jgi:hypothetical protein
MDKITNETVDLDVNKTGADQVDEIQSAKSRNPSSALRREFKHVS